MRFRQCAEPSPHCGDYLFRRSSGIRRERDKAAGYGEDVLDPVCQLLRQQRKLLFRLLPPSDLSTQGNFTHHGMGDVLKGEQIVVGPDPRL